MVDKEDIKEIINLTIQDYYGLDTKCSIIKSSPFYKQALEMSEKYGLKLKRCTQNHLRFEDTGHYNPNNEDITSTELRFDDMVKNHGLSQLHIDFTNTPGAEDHERGIYTLDEILGYYDSMPQTLKNSVGLIDFVNDDNANHSTIYDPILHKENVIYITNDAYVGLSEYGTSSHNPERIMAHEMGHCLDYGKLNASDKNFIKRIYEGDASVMNDESMAHFMNSILPKTHIYSKGDGVFGQAVQQDAIDFGAEDMLSVIPSTYAKVFYLENNDNPTARLSEHFADTVSMVSFRDKTDKRGATLDTGSPLLRAVGLGTKSDYNDYEDEVKVKQKNSVPVVEELLFGDSNIV